MKKALCMVLTLVFLLSFCPAFEADAATGIWDGTVDISWYDPGESVYYIGTPAQLAGLAALINGMVDPKCPKIVGDKSYIGCTAYPDTLLVGAGGGNVSDTVYSSAVDFAHKMVYLTADLDMGGVYDASTGKWSGPNWTPIGGKFPMKPGEVSGDCLVIDTRFNGVLDGQGHTVTNIYCDRFAAKGFPYSMAIGLVGYLGGSGDVSEISGEFEDGWQPAVRNVVVGAGSIYGRRMVGGVVGRVGETTSGVIIENCANFATIKNTDSKGVGGVCGTGWGDGVIRNCYNAGSVSTTFSCPAGGICGSNGGLDIYNCYNTGTINSNGEQLGRGIGGHDSGVYTVDNCYYLSGCDDDPDGDGYYKGTSTKITVSVTERAASEMKDQTFVTSLNANGAVFAADTAGINNGFPVLWYQTEAVSGTCSVTVQQPQVGGTISASFTGSVPYGTTLSFSAEPKAGWTFRYYTVNNSPIASDFYTVTGDITVSAVFSEVNTARIQIPEYDDFYLVVTRTGYKINASDEMVWVTDEPLSDGDTVLEENILTPHAFGYDVSPENMDSEYTDQYEFTFSNAFKNANGTYTVGGGERVSAGASRVTQAKSWLTTADTSWYNPFDQQTGYTLETPEELAGLAYLVSVDGVAFERVTITLGCDISLGNTDGSVGTRIWKAIGSSAAKSFKGIFDGKDHTINDMTAISDGSYAGLFGCCADATIKNVTVCGTVSGLGSASYAAGIIAYATSCKIENCVNRANVEASGTFAGGIAAYTANGSVITACFNYGTISGSSGVGGIAGVNYTGTDMITGCANFGSISAAGDSTYGAGGIAGRLAGAMIACANYGEVESSDRYTGGLVGYTTSRNSSSIKNSRNTAGVSSGNSSSAAALGGLVGYAQYLTMENCESTGAVSAEKSFKSGNTGDRIGKAGTVTESGLSDPGLLPDYIANAYDAPQAQAGSTFTATFFADGVKVGAATYNKGATTVTEPAVPAKEGYVGRWDNYALGCQDIIIKAAYIPVLARGGDMITRSGTYFIAWLSSGVLDIGPGLGVTLDGSLGSNSDLSVSVGSGTGLTLTDVRVTGETTLLTLAGDNTLTLAGNSIFDGICSIEENLYPTIRLLGNTKIDGGGSLLVGASANNAAISLSPGSTFELAGGNLTIDKDDKLGVEGGAFYAPGAEIKISGGTLIGHTNSDYVSVIYADSITVTGGRLKLQTEKSQLTLSAKRVILSGGLVLAVGHSPNSVSEDRTYYAEETVSVLSGSSDGRFESNLPFTDVRADENWYDAVAFCYKSGYFKGISGTLFGPDGAMTRAMFVTVLYRLAGSPGSSGLSSPFTDLSQSWYRDAVKWAVSAGVTNGTSDTAFSPNLPVTREQAAVFLYRFAEISNADLSVSSDSELYPLIGPVAPWASRQVYWAVQKGLFDGSGEVFLTPKTYASRALLAVGLMNYTGVIS